MRDGKCQGQGQNLIAHCIVKCKYIKRTLLAVSFLNEKVGLIIKPISVFRIENDFKFII